MTPGSEDRTDRWTWIEQLARQLAVDRELADAFERTPGKVARQLGLPPDAIAAVLATLSRSPASETEPEPEVNVAVSDDPSPQA